MAVSSCLLPAVHTMCNTICPVVPAVVLCQPSPALPCCNPCVCRVSVLQYYNPVSREHKVNIGEAEQLSLNLSDPATKWERADPKKQQQQPKKQQEPAKTPAAAAAAAGQQEGKAPGTQPKVTPAGPPVNPYVVSTEPPPEGFVSPVASISLVGKRIRVWWADDKAWYAGEVKVRHGTALGQHSEAQHSMRGQRTIARRNVAHHGIAHQSTACSVFEVSSTRVSQPPAPFYLLGWFCRHKALLSASVLKVHDTLTLMLCSVCLCVLVRRPATTVLAPTQCHMMMGSRTKWSSTR